jgi:hypothetical protein
MNILTKEMGFHLKLVRVSAENRKSSKTVRHVEPYLDKTGHSFKRPLYLIGFHTGKIRRKGSIRLVYAIASERLLS